MRRAHEQGMRARARWLEVGVAWIGAALLVDQVGPWASGRWQEFFNLQMAEARGGTPAVAVEWARLLPAFALLPLVGLVTLAVAGLVTRRIGVVRRMPGEQAASTAAAPAGALLLACLLSAMGAWIALRVAAGAARGVAASGEGLTTLWSIWVVRLPWILGAAALFVGLVEYGLARAQVWRSLHLTPAEVRELRRRDGVQ